MILKRFQELLSRRLHRKKQNVLRLRWQKAQLEQMLEQERRKGSTTKEEFDKQKAKLLG